MKPELYKHSVQAEKIYRGEQIRTRKKKYRDAEQAMMQLRARFQLFEDMEEDDITPEHIVNINIPFARHN